MQCTSRIYIKFYDKEAWTSFLKEFKFNAGSKPHSLYEFLDDPFSSYQYFANGVTISEAALDCEIGEFYDETNLGGLVRMIHGKIKEKAVILADSYCCSNYPETCHELYSMGGELHVYDRARSAQKHFDIPISDLKAWMGATRTKELTADEKAFLAQFTTAGNASRPKKTSAKNDPAADEKPSRTQFTTADNTATPKKASAKNDPATAFKKLWTVKKLPDGTCRLTGYKGTLEELVFPEEIGGCPISEIGNRDDPFSNPQGFKVLKRVVLPPSLRSIGRGFFRATALEEITIPDGVTKIEKELFAHCQNLKSVRLPVGLTQIDPSAFIFCKNLETINIPPKIRHIPCELFNTSNFGGACYHLKNITIEGSATTIEDRTFDLCYQVTNVISGHNECGEYYERAEGEYTVTIHAPADSCAEAYAKEKGIPFVPE